NPLASIRASMEMLADVGDREERRRFQGVVLEEVARMEHQLSELAEITRIDARLEAEEQVAVPLNGLLEQIAERFRLRENGRIRFLLEMPEEVITVRAAPARLTQAFENVIDNAASFSPDGAEVRVLLRRSADGAAVSVSDQGPGIPPSHASKIFDRFFSYRPDGGQRGRRHTGLGLAIVKTIVEGYGGAISATNDSGGGATFTVRLPASRTGVMPLRT
ncbi:MAG TPA: ATP-binding protein, partial [Thermoanaerobaculia bacterium]|nr:ATP-binding protein [Thermoanaerobaculia bacterium]